MNLPTDTQLADILQQCYGLHVTTFRPILRGLVSKKLHVYSDKREFLLRCISPKDLQDPEFALTLQQNVATVLGTAPLVVPNLHDGLWIDRAEWRFVLEEFIQGSPKHISEYEAFICGKELARLHGIAASLPQTARSCSGWRLYKQKVLYGKHILFPKELGRPELIVLSDYVDESMKQISQAIQTGMLPLGVHGDINPTNILWDCHKPRFCDFANALPTPHIIDIAMGIIGFGFLEWDLEQGAETLSRRMGPNTSIISAFLRGYSEERELSIYEKDRLKSAIVVSFVHWVKWISFESASHGLKMLAVVCRFARTFNFSIHKGSPDHR